MSKPISIISLKKSKIGDLYEILNRKNNHIYDDSPVVFIFKAETYDQHNEMLVKHLPEEIDIYWKDKIPIYWFYIIRYNEYHFLTENDGEYYGFRLREIK